MEALIFIISLPVNSDDLDLPVRGFAVEDDFEYTTEGCVIDDGQSVGIDTQNFRFFIGIGVNNRIIHDIFLFH